MNVSLPHVQLLIACIDHISMIMVKSDFLGYFPIIVYFLTNTVEGNFCGANIRGFHLNV